MSDPDDGDLVARLARDLAEARAQRDQLLGLLERAEARERTLRVTYEGRARAFVPRVRPFEGGPE